MFESPQRASPGLRGERHTFGTLWGYPTGAGGTAAGSNARVVTEAFLSASMLTAPVAIASASHRRPALSTSLRQAGRQNTCGLPPSRRGVNRFPHQGQTWSSGCGFISKASGSRHRDQPAGERDDAGPWVESSPFRLPWRHPAGSRVRDNSRHSSEPDHEQNSGLRTDRTSEGSPAGETTPDVRLLVQVALAGQTGHVRGCPVSVPVSGHGTIHTRSPHLPMQPFLRSSSAARLNAFRLASGLSLPEMAPR